MKTINIQIGKLFEFIKEKYNQTFEKDKFVKVPFKMNIKDENGEWKNVSELVRKEDDVYETKFDNGVSIKTAAKHMVCLYPEKNLNKYTDEIKVGDKLDYLNTSVISNEKILENQDVYGFQIDTDKHLYTDTNGIIHHNTYSVKTALKDNWGKSPLRQKGYKLVEVKGSIGESMSPLIAFFYTNRNKKMIILDDCDGFLINTQQSIKNLCKAVLDTDNATISFPSTIVRGAAVGVENARKFGRYDINEEDADYVDALLSDDYIDPNYDPNYQYEDDSKKKKQKEGLRFDIKTDRLKENIISLYVNDKYIGSEKIDNTFKRQLENGMKSRRMREWGEEEEDFIDEMNPVGSAGGPAVIEEIPTQFEFHSRVIFISNLTINQLATTNPAVLSRCQTVTIHLTPEEFLCRMGSILDKFDISKHTVLPTNLIVQIKNEVFRIFAIAVNLFLGGADIFGGKIEIRRQLQFRMIGDLASKWIMRADRYAMQNNIDLNPDTFSTVASAIEAKFMKYDVINYLATTE